MPQNFPSLIEYSDKYADDDYEYRHATLSFDAFQAYEKLCDRFKQSHEAHQMRKHYLSSQSAQHQHTNEKHAPIDWKDIRIQGRFQDGFLLLTWSEIRQIGVRMSPGFVHYFIW